MNASARKCIEISGTGGHKGLTFTGSHLGNVALMKDDTAYELDPEVLESYGSFGRFPYDGECFGKDVVKGFSLFETLLEPGCLFLKLLIGKSLHLRP